MPCELECIPSCLCKAVSTAVNQFRPPLNPDESAALTRLVLAYCLGRGSICLCSRSYSLQLHQPKAHADYTHYQWRRLRQFLPAIKEPRYHPTGDGGGDTGQWRLRVSSLYFETAYNLLYPNGFRLSSGVLELLGSEAIATLWADRGRVLMSRGAAHCNGRLNLSRFQPEEAELIGEWIYRLTGAEGRLQASPRPPYGPLISYDSQATEVLIASLSSTWHAQAECLERKFRRPDRRGRPPEGRRAEALRQRSRNSKAVLQRRPGRQVPQLKPQAAA